MCSTFYEITHERRRHHYFALLFTIVIVHKPDRMRQPLHTLSLTQVTGNEAYSWSSYTANWKRKSHSRWQNRVSKFFSFKLRWTRCNRKPTDTIIRTNSQPSQEGRVNLPLNAKHSQQFPGKQMQWAPNFFLHTEARLNNSYTISELTVKCSTYLTNSIFFLNLHCRHTVFHFFYIFIIMFLFYFYQQKI